MTENRPKHRTSIPLSVKVQILTEAGYMCANPRCKHILTLELHHLEWIRDGGTNDPSNLIALCSNCHDMHTRGHIPRASLDAWKQMLLLVNSSLDRESLDILLFMHKFQQKTLDIEREWEKWRIERDTELESLRANPNTTQKQLQDHEQKWQQIEPPRSREHPLRVSGDGLLRLVRLIRTGLVEEGEQQADYGDHFLAFYYWEPSLTSIGKTLADAFLNGDADAFRSILQGHEPKR